MKNNEKYTWIFGSTPPLIEQHSIVKHKILESYIRQYIAKLTSHWNIPKLQLTLVDGFSGGGCYVDEKNNILDGSPLLMLKAVNEARAIISLERNNPPEINVHYEFIDICPNTINYLNHWIKQRCEEGVVNLIDLQRTNIHQGDFLSHLPVLVDNIKQRKMGERAIFALDQYSYDNLPLPYIANILKNLKGSEVILTFNVGSLITYMANYARNRKPLKNIGLDNHIPWEEINTIKLENKYSWRKILQRYLANGIKLESGAKFATLFFVKPLGLNSWDYWLIHLSNHFVAHDVMKNLHWEYGTDFGHELEPGVFIQGYDANNDIDYTSQNTFSFKEESKAICVNGIHEHIGKVICSLNEPVLFEQILSRYISQSPGGKRHFSEALEQLHKAKEIVIVSKDGRIKHPSKNYNLDDVIEYKNQIRLIM